MELLRNGSGSFSPIMVLLPMMCTVFLMLPGASATRWTVGGNMGWTTNVNYTIWARDKHFVDGDWLFFVYDRIQMNVLEVTKADYEACNSNYRLHNWTTGYGRDVVPLNVTKHYYFISGNGFCSRGMKLTILVESAPSPPKLAPMEAEAHRFPPQPSKTTPLKDGAPGLPPQSPKPAPLDAGAPTLPPPSPEPAPLKGGARRLTHLHHVIVLLIIFAIDAAWNMLFSFW